MTSANASSGRMAAWAAFAAAAAGVLGLVAVGAWLRAGLPFEGAELSHRAAYILRHPRCWASGWLLAGFGALMVVNFYRVLAARWGTRCEGCSRLAMILATAGLAADLSGIALWMLVAPGLEAGELGLLERIAGALSLFVAKILYSAAGTLLALAGRREMGAPLTLLSLGVCLAGLSVAGTTLCGCGLAQLYSLGILVILFIVWSTLLGLRFLGIRPERGATEGPLFTPDPRD